MIKAKRGWYKLVNPEKFIKPIDEYMQSYNNGHVEYKSKLEKKAIKYCDYNKNVIKWSIEPFAIKYRKPTDGKFHRYYIDLVIEFFNGKKFLIEIKPFSQTIPPIKPIKKCHKSDINYQKAVLTYMINKAKWEAAENFATSHDMKFIILTEKELK